MTGRRLTADQVLERQRRRQAEADRLTFIALGGEALWQAELVRRRAARNARTRQRTRDALARQRAERVLGTLFDLDDSGATG